MSLKYKWDEWNILVTNQILLKALINNTENLN